MPYTKLISLIILMLISCPGVWGSTSCLQYYQSKVSALSEVVNVNGYQLKLSEDFVSPGRYKDDQGFYHSDPYMYLCPTYAELSLSFIQKTWQAWNDIIVHYDGNDFIFSTLEEEGHALSIFMKKSDSSNIPCSVDRVFKLDNGDSKLSDNGNSYIACKPMLYAKFNDASLFFFDPNPFNGEKMLKQLAH